ncbi:MULTISPECIES: hypothetical protein [unclassified Ectothiorhodospira]|nr:MULTISPECIES: hypothetical protein [unclassified Ectothiorhodospira]MCG5516881.1 hypothetical protein [Ectothiorhodospira sp. 9100]MCG5519843.1 hypothetical protein [Ectothiorhodospira sp. 9905]
MTRLSVQHLAQIDRAQVDFGDLTLLVGPQASGKLSEINSSTGQELAIL